MSLSLTCQQGRPHHRQALRGLFAFHSYFLLPYYFLLSVATQLDHSFNPYEISIFEGKNKNKGEYQYVHMMQFALISSPHIFVQWDPTFLGIEVYVFVFKL